jgi:hypothetical protein
MLCRFLAAWILVGMAVGRAAPPPPASTLNSPSLNTPAKDPQLEPEKDAAPLLPPHLPGYDLRVLDVKKPLLFNVAGTWVEVSIPIFFYFPTPAREEGVKRLRQVTEDLRQLIRKPAWTSAELARVQVELDASASLLAQP